MSEVLDLLPPNRTALESAVVQVLHQQQHPERSITALYSPRSVPNDLLPWLAWGQDVLAWPETAGDALRRNITASSWQLHRRMGTLAGMQDMAAIYGARIAQAIVPPSKTHAGASYTLAERNAFLQRYPQLRLYPQRLTGKRVGAMLQRCFVHAGAYPVRTNAAQRLAPQAFVYESGRETALQSTERSIQTQQRSAHNTLEVRRPSVAGRRSFAGLRPGWLLASDAGRRMYRLVTDTAYLDSSETLRHTAVAPGLDLLDVRYDWVAGQGQALGIHPGGAHVHSHLRGSTARERIYKRWWLFDPAVDVHRRGAISFCGTTRLSMPAHHAQLCVAISGRIHPRAAGRFVMGYAIASSHQNYHDTLAGLARMARASDRIAIDTFVTTPIVASESLRAGAATAGDWAPHT